MDAEIIQKKDTIINFFDNLDEEKQLNSKELK